MPHGPSVLVHSTLLIGLSAVAFDHALASHSSLTSNELRVSATQSLGFGRLLNDLAAGSSETVSFTDGGSALKSGTNVISVGGTVQPARFVLSASESTMTGQSITVSAGAFLDSANTNQTLPWRWLKADYGGSTATDRQAQGQSLVVTLTNVTVPTTGETLRAFGAMEMEAADAAGTYVGTVTVTANHQ